MIVKSKWFWFCLFIWFWVGVFSLFLLLFSDCDKGDTHRFLTDFNFRYCLDNRRALERDVGYAELQTRLIRYETQTTCTKECCPVPVGLSPLPSPAVLSEPGSVPDGESLQSEFKTEASRLKRRSKDLDCFYPKKR